MTPKQTAAMSLTLTATGYEDDYLFRVESGPTPLVWSHEPNASQKRRRLDARRQSRPAKKRQAKGCVSKQYLRFSPETVKVLQDQRLRAKTYAEFKTVFDH